MAIRLWPKSWWRRVVVVFAVALFVPYLASRVLSPWRQVRVYSGKFVPENIDGGIRIVAYNIAHRRGSAESNEVAMKGSGGSMRLPSCWEI